jgi:hypothetical protein
VAVKIDQKIVRVSIVDECEDNDAVLDDFPDELDCDACDYKINHGIQNYGQHTKRPKVLPGANYKIKNPLTNKNVYCSINNMGGSPYEMFLNSKDTASQEWVSAVTVLVSMSLRAGIPSELIGRELRGITAVNSYFYEGRNACTISHIGELILQHTRDEDNELSTLIEKTDSIISDAEPIELRDTGLECPECNEMSLIKEGGCTRCIREDCGYMGECG